MSQKELEGMLTTTFSEYGDAVFRFSLLRTADSQAAIDITRAAFVYYWQCLRDERRMVNSHMLLYETASKLANEWCQGKTQSLKWHFEPESLGGKQAILDSVAAYQEAFDPLSDIEEHDREALLLKHVDGLKPKEIGLLLEETPTTVSARLERAASHLRKKLGV